MILFITGRPGSGKSYAAVYYLWESVYRKSSLGTYYLPNGVMVVSNIQNLRLPHRNFDELWEKHGKSVFSVDFWKKVAEKYALQRVVFVIDEVQKYLYREKDPEVLFFFQYHRHLGIEFIGITQTEKAIPRELFLLSEFFYRAIPRSRNLGRYFLYHILDSSTGEKLGVKKLPKKKEIFALYTSQEMGEMENPPNFLLRYIGLAAGGVLASAVAFGFLLHHFFSPPKEKVPQKRVSKVERVVQPQRVVYPFSAVEVGE